MKKAVHPDDLLARIASGALSAADESLLLRAENAALARYYRSRALADRARGAGEEPLTRSDGSDAPLEARPGGKPPH
jgi:hypothetical protein